MFNGELSREFGAGVCAYGLSVVRFLFVGVEYGNVFGGARYWGFFFVRGK